MTMWKFHYCNKLKLFFLTKHYCAVYLLLRKTTNKITIAIFTKNKMYCRNKTGKEKIKHKHHKIDTVIFGQMPLEKPNVGKPCINWGFTLLCNNLWSTTGCLNWQVPSKKILAKFLREFFPSQAIRQQSDHSNWLSKNPCTVLYCNCSKLPQICIWHTVLLWKWSSSPLENYPVLLQLNPPPPKLNWTTYTSALRKPLHSPFCGLKNASNTTTNFHLKCWILMLQNSAAPLVHDLELEFFPALNLCSLGNLIYLDLPLLRCVFSIPVILLL